MLGDYLAMFCSVRVRIANSCVPQRSGRLKFIRKWNQLTPSCKSWRTRSRWAIQTTSDSLKSACQIYADLQWCTEQNGKSNALMKEQWIRNTVPTRKKRSTWPEAKFYYVHNTRTSLLQSCRNCSWGILQCGNDLLLFYYLILQALETFSNELKWTATVTV